MKKLLFFLFRYSPWMVGSALLAGLLTGAASTGLIGLINKAIQYHGQSPQALIVLFAGLCLALPLLRVVSQILLSTLTHNAIFDLRMHLAQEILKMPLRDLEKNGPGKLLSVLTHDIQVVGNTLTTVPMVFMNMTIIVTGFGYLLWLNWQAGLIMLLAGLAGILIFSKIVSIAQRFYHKARAEQDTFFRYFRALTDGAKELKLHATRKRYFLERMLQAAGRSYRMNHVKGSAYIAAAMSTGQFIIFFAVGSLVIFLPRFNPEIDPSVMTGFSLFLLYLMTPLNTLIQTLPQFSIAVVSLEKITALGISLDNFSVNLDDVPAEQPQESWAVTFEEIHYTYFREDEDRAFHLGPISLDLSPGEILFIIGGNGSGKTTLAKLLTGLYKPDSGEISINREPVKDINLFRQLFTAVFSDYYLFDSMMGISRSDADQLAEKHLKDLRLDHKVTFKDGAWSTTDLSQGQRKRLALLSAYLEDRPIYLFDEWAADQDPSFKEVFYLVILPELKSRGKTVVVISHDDHYYHVADRILKLNEGKLDGMQKKTPY